MVNNRKDWNDIKSNDSWSIFKIMSEFVEAYDRMAKIGPCVSIFGSARTKEENPYYKLRKTSQKEVMGLSQEEALELWKQRIEGLKKE